MQCSSLNLPFPVWWMNQKSMTYLNVQFLPKCLDKKRAHHTIILLVLFLQYTGCIVCILSTFSLCIRTKTCSFWKSACNIILCDARHDFNCRTAYYHTTLTTSAVCWIHIVYTKHAFSMHNDVQFLSKCKKKKNAVIIKELNVCNTVSPNVM